MNTFNTDTPKYAVYSHYQTKRTNSHDQNKLTICLSAVLRPYLLNSVLCRMITCVQFNIPLITSCRFFSRADSCLRTSSSTPLDQSTGSGSTSKSLSHSAALLLRVGVTVVTSCVRAVTISKELLGLSKLLQ